MLKKVRLKFGNRSSVPFYHYLNSSKRAGCKFVTLS